MNLNILTNDSVKRRNFWVEKISQISGDFGEDAERIEKELVIESENNGISTVLDHLRLCGAIPETYNHDSSEEKLYSKYTDVILAVVFRYIGLQSIVLTERANSADVEVIGRDYSFVADAKSFRLSRTAKNQKDFKIEAMASWKRSKPYAVVVSPLYQLPRRNSQIYHQAISRNVTILSYSHLAVILSTIDKMSPEFAQKLLGTVFRTVEALNPSKDATEYFLAINNAMLDFDKTVRDLWLIEKQANLDAIEIAKEEALEHLAKKRENIMRMSRDQVVTALIRELNIDGREKQIRSVFDNNLLSQHRNID